MAQVAKQTRKRGPYSVKPAPVAKNKTKDLFQPGLAHTPKCVDGFRPLHSRVINYVT